MILYIATLISCIFRISTQISDQDFKTIVTLVQKRTLPFVTLHNQLFNHCLHHLNHCLHHLRRNQWYQSKKITLKCPKFLICEVWPNNLGICQIEAQPARNYQIFKNFFQFKKKYVTNFVQSQFWWIVDSGFNGIRHIFIQSFVLVVYGVN